MFYVINMRGILIQPHQSHSYTIRTSKYYTTLNTGLNFAGPLYVRDKLIGATESQEIRKGLRVFYKMCVLKRIEFWAHQRTVSHSLSASIPEIHAKGFPVLLCLKLTNHQVSWQFIVEKASWWGGYWERMVRSVKCYLRKTLGCSTLIFDELGTLNNRSLKKKKQPHKCKIFL